MIEKAKKSKVLNFGFRMSFKQPHWTSGNDVF